MYDEIITLISKKNTEKLDKYGDPVIEETRRDIFAECRSIGMKEFYQAQTSGFKPEIAFKIADYLEYQNEEELIYNGFRYKILRTFRKNTELELTCYGGVRDVGA